MRRVFLVCVRVRRDMVPAHPAVPDGTGSEVVLARFGDAYVWQQGTARDTLRLHTAGVAIVKSYLLYPKESGVQEWLEVVNRSGRPALLAEVDGRLETSVDTYAHAVHLDTLLRSRTGEH